MTQPACSVVSLQPRACLAEAQRALKDTKGEGTALHVGHCTPKEDLYRLYPDMAAKRN